MERPRRGTGKMLTLKIQYSKCAGGKNDDRNNEKRFGKNAIIKAHQVLIYEVHFFINSY